VKGPKARNAVKTDKRSGSMALGEIEGSLKKSSVFENAASDRGPEISDPFRTDETDASNTNGGVDLANGGGCREKREEPGRPGRPLKLDLNGNRSKVIGYGNTVRIVTQNEYEHQIDKVVYNLYGLTDEEIAIVEEEMY
jgi:hypothetical protein